MRRTTPDVRPIFESVCQNYLLIWAGKNITNKELYDGVKVSETNIYTTGRQQWETARLVFWLASPTVRSWYEETDEAFIALGIDVIKMACDQFPDSVNMQELYQVAITSHKLNGKALLPIKIEGLKVFGSTREAYDRVLPLLKSFMDAS